MAATPDQVYAVLSDPTRVGEWSHEAHRARWLGQPAAPVVGARFVGSNRVGLMRWDMPCTIIAAEPGRRFAYHTRNGRPGTEWDYTLVPSGEGTRVLQRWRILHLPRPAEILIHLAIPAHRDRREALADDLVRLGEVAAREHRPAAAA